MIIKLLKSPYVFLLVIALLMYATPLKDVTWGKITTSYPSSVTVQGSATSEETNKMANFSATVIVKNADKEIAVAELNGKIDKLTDSIKLFGIAENDIQTQSLNIYQMDVYNQMTQTSEKKDWYASNSVNIKLRDISKSNDLTMLLTSTGADNIWGPNFTVDNDTMTGDKLMDMAIDNAKQKAEAVAKKTGKKLGNVLFVQEGGYNGYYPMPFASTSGIGMGGGGGGEMYPGTSTVTKTVSVTYELR